MNIEATSFYYASLSCRNICTRLTSLRVSDATSIGNGLWFAKHGSTFINLRHLSLIDIERSTFEMILNSLSPIPSLIMFSVQLISFYNRAAFTIQGVTEGAYHEQIFRLFFSLCICHLLFARDRRHTVYNSFIAPFYERFVLIQSNYLSLQSVTLRYCSPTISTHFFEYLPRLEQLSCDLTNTYGMPEQHPLKYDDNK